jgi:hypothetical protein
MKLSAAIKKGLKELPTNNRSGISGPHERGGCALQIALVGLGQKKTPSPTLRAGEIWGDGLARVVCREYDLHATEPTFDINKFIAKVREFEAKPEYQKTT